MEVTRQIWTSFDEVGVLSSDDDPVVLVVWQASHQRCDDFNTMQRLF